jgi:hypothetical protein
MLKDVSSSRYCMDPMIDDPPIALYPISAPAPDEVAVPFPTAAAAARNTQASAVPGNYAVLALPRATSTAHVEPTRDWKRPDPAIKNKPMGESKNGPIHPPSPMNYAGSGTNSGNVSPRLSCGWIWFPILAVAFSQVVWS